VPLVSRLSLGRAFLSVALVDVLFRELDPAARAADAAAVANAKRRDAAVGYLYFRCDRGAREVRRYTLARAGRGDAGPK
jgi:hypothetical protein